MKNKLFTISIIIEILISLVITIYFILFYKPNWASAYNYTEYKTQNDYYETYSKLLNTKEFSSNNDNLIFILKREKISNFINSYSIEMASSDVTNDISFNANPKITNLNIETTEHKTAIAYQYETNNYYNKYANYNYITLFLYENNNTDLNKSYIIYKSFQKTDLIKMFPQKDDFTIFFIKKEKPPKGKLIETKSLYMVNIKNIGTDYIIEEPKEIRMPELYSLFELKILKNNDNEYILIYLAKIKENRDKDIIISKMDNEGNIKYSSNLPIKLPEGIISEFEVCSNKINDKTFAVTFGNINLTKNTSSLVVIFFDENGNLKPKPYIELNIFKSEIPKDIKIINHNDIFFVFFKYENTGFYVSVVDEQGKILIQPSQLDENNKKSYNLSIANYKDNIITIQDNIVIILNNDHKEISKKTKNTLSKKLISYSKNNITSSIFNDTMVLGFIKDKICYVGFISINSLIN